VTCGEANWSGWQDSVRELWMVLERLAPMGIDDAVEVSPGRDTTPIRRVITSATAQAFQVQLLTGQRLGEVRDVKWSHVDLEAGWWTLPASATKNGKAHRVPLTEWAVASLRERRRAASDSAIHVFENKPDTGSILHRGKKAASLLCKILTFESARMISAAPPRRAWPRPASRASIWPSAESHRGRRDGDSRVRPVQRRRREAAGARGVGTIAEDAARERQQPSEGTRLPAAVVPTFGGHRVRTSPARSLAPLSRDLGGGARGHRIPWVTGKAGATHSIQRGLDGPRFGVAPLFA
jgi:hypothetical protein